MSDELIRRLEVAAEGSRELDAHVEVAIRAVLAARTGLAREHWAKWTVSRDFYVEDSHTAYKPDPVTTSLDAALALAERVLPTVWTWRVEKDGEGYFAAFWSDPEYAPESEAVAQTPALALCIAVLKARTAANAD